MQTEREIIFDTDFPEQCNDISALKIIDNCIDVVAQRKLQEVVDCCAQAIQLHATVNSFLY
jgi:hypothetical protein